jgi:hypothetical protein
VKFLRATRQVRRINSAGGVSGLHLIASQSSHRSNNGLAHKQQCDELFAGAFAADGQLKIERWPRHGWRRDRRLGNAGRDARLDEAGGPLLGDRVTPQHDAGNLGHFPGVARAIQRHWAPVRVGRSGRSLQLGRASRVLSQPVALMTAVQCISELGQERRRRQVSYSPILPDDQTYG